MTDRKVLVGTIDYPVAKKMVHKALDVVELSGTASVPVKTATARKWKKEAGGKIGFTLQVPKHLFEKPPAGAPLPGNIAGYGGFKVSQENVGLFNDFVSVADAAGAQSVVMLTPASFTPAKANRDALAKFLKAVRVQGEDDETDRDLVWEPKGPWDPEQAMDFALEQNLILAVDPLRDEAPAGATAYFRLGPFAAMGSRMGLYDLERIGEAIAPFGRVTCVFQTNRALDDARNLKKVLAGDFVDE